jgi:hypothetical protein
VATFFVVGVDPCRSGGVAPIERFKLAEPRHKPAKPLAETATVAGPVTTRRVSRKGTIGFATVVYEAGAWLAGQTVEVTCDGGSRTRLDELPDDHACGRVKISSR